MQRFKLLGLPVDSIGLEEVYDKIFELSQSNKPTRVVLLDTYLLLRATLNSNLRKIISTADLVLPISPGIKFGLRLFKKKISRVYNYFNFTINLLLYFGDKQKFIYILGGNKKIISKIDVNLRDSFPGIRIVGKYHCNYKKSFEPNLITAIKKASPSLILVGNSSPKQEKWIYSKKNNFDSGVMIGVGDFFNIVGGKGGSPSEKAIQSGLYGVTKMFKNPLRIFRIFLYSLYFPFLIFSLIFNRK